MRRNIRIKAIRNKRGLNPVGTFWPIPDPDAPEKKKPKNATSRILRSGHAIIVASSAKGQSKCVVAGTYIAISPLPIKKARYDIGDTVRFVSGSPDNRSGKSMKRQLWIRLSQKRR